jgi:DNA polymerase III delta prime subunit
MRHRHLHTAHRQPSPPTNDLKAAYPLVLRALQGWRKDIDDAPLADLLLYEQARHQLGFHADARALTAHVLEEGLRRLATVDADAVHLLRQRFQQDLSRQQLAIQYHRSLPHFDRMQRDAILKLVEAIDDAEREARATVLYARASRSADLRLRLDLAAGNDRLFGVDTYSSALVEWLERPGPPHFLLLEGLGGIGKTALTAAVLRQILDGNIFDDIAWVTARQRRFLFSGEILPIYNTATDVANVIIALAEQVLPAEERPLPFTMETVLPRLRTRLQSQRTLLVVDNLETVTEIESLLSVLRSLADPAKLLLTSRVYPRTDATLYRLVLPELERTYADQMVRYLAEIAGIGALVAAGEKFLSEIYSTIGGNPLALRLLVGQCRHHSPETVLHSLRQMQGDAEEQLYTFIYQHAWDALDEPARELLLALALIPPEGADQTYIIASSGLRKRTVHDGLARLVNLNLVEHRLNQARQSRYAIHSLTRTFLHTQILS